METSCSGSASLYVCCPAVYASRLIGDAGEAPRPSPIGLERVWTSGSLDCSQKRLRVYSSSSLELIYGRQGDVALQEHLTVYAEALRRPQV